MVMVNSTNAVVSSTPVESSAADDSLADFDTFLQLLTAQLANQDPLNPTDGTEFTGQLAQFSSLEQQINTNELLQEQLDSMPDNKQSEAISYIGKEVLAPGSSFKLGTAGNIEFTYEVEGSIESATASVYDADGEKVREFTVETSEGLHEVLWDGRDDNGNRLDSGIYSVKVEAASINSDASTSNQQLSTYIYSEAEKITDLGDDYAILTSDGRTIKMDDILGARSFSSSDTTETDHATALQMLGKDILIPGSQFTYAGQDLDFTYGLTQDVTSVIITITDEDGNQVKQVPFESSEGSHEYTWDGTDSNGNTVDAGTYNIEVKAQETNSEGGIDEEFLDTLYYGEATKVESSDGVVVLYTQDGRTAYYNQVVATKN